MAGSISKGGGNRRWKPQAEINVTPFVDVMLVLLIVFMITAPLLTVGVAVDLPETEARAMPANEEPLTITIGADGVIYLQETEVELETLVPRLQAIAGATGGRHLGTATALPSDLAFDPPRVVRVDRRADVELWSRPGLLVLALLCLGLEWLLRQRSGYL